MIVTSMTSTPKKFTQMGLSSKDRGPMIRWERVALESDQTKRADSRFAIEAWAKDTLLVESVKEGESFFPLKSKEKQEGVRLPLASGKESWAPAHHLLIKIFLRPVDEAMVEANVDIDVGDVYEIVDLKVLDQLLLGWY